MKESILDYNHLVLEEGAEILGVKLILINYSYTENGNIPIYLYGAINDIEEKRRNKIETNIETTSYFINKENDYWCRDNIYEALDVYNFLMD